MGKKSVPVEKIDPRAASKNRHRFQAELSQAIYDLMQTDKRSNSWLARRLDVSPSYVTKILGSPTNFTAAQIADITFAFGRGIHLVLGAEAKEMRMPVDEKLAATAKAQNETVTDCGDGPYPIGKYRSPQQVEACDTMATVQIM